MRCSAGTDIDATPTYPAEYTNTNIMSIIATDENDQLANYSNYGLHNTDIAAPGSKILSTILNGQVSSADIFRMSCVRLLATVAMHHLSHCQSCQNRLKHGHLPIPMYLNGRGWWDICMHLNRLGCSMRLAIWQA